MLERKKFFFKLYELSILTFIFSSPFFYSKYVFYQTFFLKEFYIVLISILFILIFLFKKEGNLEFNYYFLLFIFLLFWIGLGFFKLNVNKYLLMERLLILLNFIIFLYSFFQIKKNINLEKLIKILIFSNFIITLFSLLQLINFIFNLDIFFKFGNLFNNRIYSVFGNPDNYGIYIILILPFIFYQITFSSKKIFYIILFSFNFLFLILTKSLSSYIAFLVQVVILIFVYNFSKKIKIISFFAIFLFLIFFVFIFKNLYLNKKPSFEIRKFLYLSTFKMIKENILTGVGYGNYRIFIPYYQGLIIKNKKFSEYIKVHDEAYVHNDFLQFFAELGFVGGILCLILILYPFFFFLKNYKNKKKYEKIIFISLSGVIIFSLFNFPFHIPYIFILYFMLSLYILNFNKNLIIPIKIIKIFLFIFIIINIWFLQNIFVRYYLTKYLSYNLAHNQGRYAIKTINKLQNYIINDYQLCFYSGTIYKQIDIDKGIFFLKRAVSLFPYFEGALYNLGNAYFKKGEFKKAEKIYKKILNFNDKNLSVYTNLGSLYIKSYELKKAQNILKKAIFIKKNYIPAHFNLALLYFLSNNYKKTWAELQYILDIDKNYEPAKQLKEKLVRTISK